MASTILSDNGVTSGSAGLKTTAASDGALALQTTTAGGTATTALTIDTSQNVGIGTASPVTKVDIQSTVGLAYKAKRTSSGVAGGIGAGATTQGLAIFTTDYYADTAIIFGVNQTDSSPNPFLGLTERMRINATAPILCLSGGNTSATGTGIAFPATQSASSDANTLDDYEEGTWTPTLTADVTPSSVSYAAQTARYTKIGNTVTIWVYLSINSYTGGSGSTFISGLPFTCNSTVQGGMSLNWANNGFVSTVAFGAHIPINQARGYVVYFNGGATAQLPLSQWTTNTQFIATGSYQV